MLKALLMAIIVVGGVVIGLLRARNKGTHRVTPSTLSQFPPVPNWRPNMPVDLDRIAATFSYYTDSKSAFAIFKHGTCVPVEANPSRQVVDAIQTMDKLFHQHADFSVRRMDDGNWLVSYSGRAFSVVFSDDIQEYWPVIEERHLDAVAGHEVLLSAGRARNVFDKSDKVGLFGRAYWFMDAQQPEVVRVISPEG